MPDKEEAEAKALLDDMMLQAELDPNRAEAYSKALLAFGDEEVPVVLKSAEWVEFEALIDMVLDGSRINREGYAALRRLRDALASQYGPHLPAPTAVQMVEKMREAGLL